MGTEVGVSLVFTDLVGSTELSTRVGAAEAERLRLIHFGLLGDAVEATGGRVVKNLGDGIMAVFVGVGAALDASVAMQQAFHRYNATSDGASLVIRTGVATGDCTEDEGDFFGEPVVQAARLCALAEESQILAPEVVRLLAPRGGHEFTSMGERELRGIPEPVAVVEVVWHPVDAGRGPLVPLPDRLAISHPFGFVGRDAERELLRDAWKATSAGERRVVLLSGEAGLGKTRLSTELAREVFDVGGLVLYGRCDEELPSPYRPWVEALGHYVSHAGGDEFARLDDRMLDELAAVVPGLHDRTGGRSVGLREGRDGDQLVLFAAMTDLLTSLARDQLVLVVLDDLHWADRATLQLLRHVVGQTLVARLLIVGTYRDTDIGVDHPMRATLAALRRETGCDRIALLGLSDVEVLSLMEETAGHELESDGVGLAGALRAETAGNPFFVGEMLRHLAETGQIVRQDDGRWVTTIELGEVGLPESIREVVGARVRRLGDEAARVLGAAAVIGREFEVSLVGAVVDRDADRVVDALEPAVAAGLVAEVAHTPDRFTFTHALVQHTLYADLPASRRARWHLRIAETIELLDGGAVGRSGELATHWFAATRPADATQAIRYAVLAGDEAVAAFAPDDAVRWYRQADDAISDRESLQCCEVMVRLGEAERQAGDPAHRQRLIDAARLAERLDDTDLLVKAALANFRGYASAGSVDTERIEVLEAALRASGGGNSAERARLLATLSVEFAYHGPRTVELARDAIDTARRTGDQKVVLDTILRAGGAFLTPSLYAEHEGLTEDALLLTEGLDDQRRCHALGRRATALKLRGDISGVRRCLVEQQAISDRLGLPFWRWQTRIAASSVALITGDASSAERMAEEALELGLETGQPDAVTLYGSLLIALRWHQGRLVEITDLIAEAAADNPNLPVFQAIRAFTLASTGSLVEAQPIFRTLAQDAFAFPDDDTWILATTFAAETAHLLEDRGAAAVLLERLEPHRDLIAADAEGCTGAVSHYLGCLESTLGLQPQAEASFFDALERHERLEAPFFRARTMLELAGILAGTQAPRAGVLLTEALALADSFGMAGIRQHVSDLRAAIDSRCR